MHVDRLLWLIPALPFLGFLLNGLVGPRLDKPTVGVLAVLGPLAAFVLSILAFLQAHHGEPATQVVWQWITTGSIAIDFGLQADPLTSVMLLNVTGIGTLIHVYSYGYMHEDPSFSRFMAYLNLFLSAMLILVMADNLVLLFVGWEGVGLCSYLLIGFWYTDLANVDAGRKAFVVNRIGDFAFLIGTFTLFGVCGSLGFAGMEQAVLSFGDVNAILDSGPLEGWSVRGALMFAGLCLFGGATGKSAQIPLYTWLPDAMAGPTPVSALIHAATMVTAGVYLIGRMDFLFVALPEVSQVVALVAASTALLSGIIAVSQNDIKKVLAYSTVSQLGFMFCGMATTVWVTGMFHVVTHAFFKALLFLGAGAVIHALHGEQDIRKMGGLRHDLPLVTGLFIVGSLALAGVPPFAGFFSKDEILGAVHLLMSEEGGLWIVVFAMLVLSAILTAFYTTRLVILTFFGKPYDAHRHLHHNHWTMTSVLVVLAVLSAFGGLVLLHPFEHFLEHGWSVAPWMAALSEEHIHHSHNVALFISLVAVGVGGALGLLLYTKQRAPLQAFVEGPGRALNNVVLNKFYVDELYDMLIVRPIGVVSHALWAWVDRMLIDGFVVEGSGKMVVAASAVLRRTQIGVVSVSTAAMLLGAVLVLLWVAANG